MRLNVFHAWDFGWRRGSALCKLHVPRQSPRVLQLRVRWLRRRDSRGTWRHPGSADLPQRLLTTSSPDKLAQLPRRNACWCGLRSTYGVFLPDRATSAAPGMYHRTLHTNRYYEAVNNALRDVRTREEAIEVLGDIRQQLLNGTFPK